MENRGELRVRFQRPVRVVHGAAVSRGQIENISAGGVMVSLEPGEVPPTGERVTAHFVIPGLPNPVAARAVVRWSSQALPGVVGLTFDTPLDDQAKALINALAANEAG